MTGSWGARADAVLAELFLRGREAPTREAVRDAYPFGERAYWPYRVWCQRVKAWQLAHATGLSEPKDRDDRRSSIRPRQEACSDPNQLHAL
jgi:hypothetical protein